MFIKMSAGAAREGEGEEPETGASQRQREPPRRVTGLPGCVGILKAGQEEEDWKTSQIWSLRWRRRGSGGIVGMDRSYIVTGCQPTGEVGQQRLRAVERERQAG